MEISTDKYQAFLAGLISGDYSACESMSRALLDAGFTPVALYTDLFQRALYEIGEMWERNQLSVATEHIATGITERLLATLYPALLRSRQPNGHSAIISCSANEYHQVGARMVADILDAAGWDTTFIGANTPVQDLMVAIDQTTPDVVGLSASIYFNLPHMRETVDRIRVDFPNLDMLVGGQAFRWGGHESLRQLPGVQYLESVRDLNLLAS